MIKKDRTIIVGDIHGCIEEFDELRKTIQYEPEKDRLILVGDLIDRGPDSVGVVRRARELDLECTMGNHEAKFLKWYKSNGSSNDVYDRHPHYTQMSDKDVNYIANMPYYIKVSEDLWVVHAGVKPNIPLEKQKKDDLAYLRFTDKDRHFISMHKVGKGTAVDAMFWTEFWKGPASVVYGHHVHSYEQPKIEEVAPGVTCYGIDTGTCFGGKLTALIVESGEIVQVQAKQIYYKSSY